jgi:hypothetical protein
VGGFTMVRPAGKNEVWQANGLFPYMLNRDTKAWRDKTILEFPFAEASKLTVDAAGGKLTLEKLPPEKDAKPGEPARWKIVESTGDAPKTSEQLDAQQVNGAIMSLASLKAADFAEDKKPEETGVDHPQVTVTVTAAGKARTLAVGESKGDDVFVRVTDLPTTFVIKKYAAERIARRPADYRDKTLTKIKADDLASIDITDAGETIALEQAGGKWKSRGKVAADEGKLKPVVSAFENLAGSSFAVEKEPAKTGLAKPTGTVALHLKDKSTVTLKVGALSKDGSEYYVQKVGSPDVVMIKKFMVDRFLKKASDLQAGAPTAQAPMKKK